MMANQASAAMKKPLFPTSHQASHSRLSKTLVYMAGVLLLAGCASPTPRSLGTLKAADTATISRLTNNLAEESAKLAAAREETRQLIEHRSTQEVPVAIAPQHDPLEDIVVSVKLQNAT